MIKPIEKVEGLNLQLHEVSHNDHQHQADNTSG